MFVVAEHQISNPSKFWESVRNAAPALLQGVRLHHTLPSSDGTRAVCLWEARSFGAVKELVERTVGEWRENRYFEVDARNAIGLPR